MLDRTLIPTPLVPLAEVKPVLIKQPTRPSHFRISYLFVFLRFLLAVLGLAVRRRLTRQAYAHRLRVAFEELGGLWIKLGQLLSLRTDVFSHAFCQEMARLQSQAEGFPPAMARQIIEEELGAPVETFFDDFEQEPFAAASIGQVHRARLKDQGTPVAIKVQRPYASEIFIGEMAFIRLLVWIFEKLWFIPNLQWDEMLWELTQILNEEIDYRIEATAIQRMRKNLRKHRIYVHKVFSAYSTRRVLVTEYITGVLMADYIHVKRTDPLRLQKWQQDNNVQPRKVARRLFDSLWRQLLEDNLFHADLHPGNIFLLRDGRLTLIDFGAIGSMEKEYQQKYFMMMKAMAAKEYDKVADCLFLISGALPPTDLTEVKKKLIRCLRGWDTRSRTRDLPYHERSMSALANGLIRILFQYECPADWSFLRITRAQETVDQSLMHLYPEANYTKLMTWYFKQTQRRRRQNVFAQAELTSYVDDLLLVLRLPLRRAENATFESWILRRQALSFHGAVSKTSQFFAILCARGVILVGVALAYLILVFLKQQYAWDPAVLGRGLAQEVNAFPWDIPYLAWLLILVFGLNLLVTLASLARRFARTERQPLDSS
jgi:ubiquinone biosynthesis protein